MVTTEIGNYELEEYLFINEKIGFPNTLERKSPVVLRGGGGKLHVFGSYYNELQGFGRLTYPSSDSFDSAFSHVLLIHCYHRYGDYVWADFQEEVRYIKKTDILVVNYKNDSDADFPKNIELEGYFFVHPTLPVFVQLRYIKNNSTEEKTLKLFPYISLSIAGTEGNESVTWDAIRNAFLAYDTAGSPKNCYMLIGSPTTPTKRGTDYVGTIWSQCWNGTLEDKDSYQGNAGVGFRFDITLAPGASSVLPFYIVVSDTQTNVESAWDSAAAKTYQQLLSETSEWWENWVDEGIVTEFPDKPWLTEAWIRNVISAKSLTWDNGGISAATYMYFESYVFDSYFAIRSLLQSGHISEVRSYLSFLRDKVAHDNFNPYPHGAYPYSSYRSDCSGPNLFHGVFYTPILVWELYQKTRLLTDLSDNWDMVKKYVDYAYNNWYNATYKLMVDNGGLMDHPFRYHTGWAEGKYYSAFNIGYLKAFEVGAKIAELTGHVSEKALYESIAANIEEGLNTRLFVDGVYKSIWHPTLFPTPEGWDIETCSKLGEVGFDSETQTKTFKTWQSWFRDYLPPHYDEIDYANGQDWIYSYALGNFMQSLILYGNYAHYTLFLERYKNIANLPLVKSGEKVGQRENPAGQPIFTFAYPIIGSLARLFDWTINNEGNYDLAISPAPQIGTFIVTFPDGTTITVTGEGDGPNAEISISPYAKNYIWDSERKKLSVTLKPEESFVFHVVMGSVGIRARENFKKLLSSHGEIVEILKKVGIGQDSFGNPIYDYVTQGVERAFIQPLKGDEEVVSAGLLSIGDAVGFFNPQTKLAKNYMVGVNGDLYEAVSIEKTKTQGVVTYVKANLKKVVK